MYANEQDLPSPLMTAMLLIVALVVIATCLTATFVGNQCRQAGYEYFTLDGTCRQHRSGEYVPLPEVWE